MACFSSGQDVRATCSHMIVIRLSAVLFIASMVDSASSAVERPNIVFILADDLGYMDVNAFASRITGEGKEKMFLETPNIDKLAAGGLSFSQAYAYQLCSPTRASLLTGRDAPVIGVTTATPGSARSFYSKNEKPPAGYMGQDALYWGDPIETPQALLNGSTLLALPAGHEGDGGEDAFTFAEALPAYRSAFIGKWHLGGHGAVGYQPKDQGFEEIAYFDAGGSPFRNWRGLWDRKQKYYPEMPQDDLRIGKSGEATGEDYLTDDLTVQADRFIRLHHETKPDQPFLLYFCQFAVHSPFQAKQEDIDYFAKKPTRGWNGHQDPVYAGMVRSLDDSVGKIMATLDELEIADNTLVVFMSDNGGIGYILEPGDTPVTNNAPLKGGKAMMYEGGIRVPLIFRWPGAIPAGSWSDVPVGASDLFPTLVEVGGIDTVELAKEHHIDGSSLKPLFNDPENSKKGYKRDTFIWHYPFNVKPLDPKNGFALTPHSAIRKGDFKLIYDWNGSVSLYDIRNDVSEQNDLSELKPSVTRELFGELNDWLDENVATKYMPALNPDYDADKEPRVRPFVDLRRHFLGADRAIRSTQDDARFEILLQSE
ncbi:MAG: sulfatase [Akkermansiaceae bacterium]|nr:sulfatase [Akkermansiaceae bacterium]